MISLNITAATASPATVAALVAGSFLALTSGAETATARISSITGGAATLGFYATDNGVDLYPIGGLPIGAAQGAAAIVRSVSAVGAWDLHGGAPRVIYLIATTIGGGVSVAATLADTKNPRSQVVSGVAGVTGVVVGASANPSATFNRPADTTPYASGDLVADTTTAVSVTPMQFTIARAAAGAASAIKARLRKTGTSITNAAFRLHLWSTAPTVASGDNGVLSATASASYLGSIDFPTPATNGLGNNMFSDGACFNGTPLVGQAITAALSSGQVVYGLLEARGAYTPASGETFAVALEVLQD
jgi:hypothetical protein